MYLMNENIENFITTFTTNFKNSIRNFIEKCKKDELFVLKAALFALVLAGFALWISEASQPSTHFEKIRQADVLAYIDMTVNKNNNNETSDVTAEMKAELASIIRSKKRSARPEEIRFYVTSIKRDGEKHYTFEEKDVKRDLVVFYKSKGSWYMGTMYEDWLNERAINLMKNFI